MNSLEFFLLDYKECRRRFLLTAAAFPDELLTWRPDKDALSVGETIRHVLLHDFSWLRILKDNRLPTDEEQSDLWEEPYTNLQNEVDRASVYYDEFINYVSSLNINDLGTKYINWPHKSISRTLGDTLERKSYHDAVHTGQLLQYLRMLHIDRPIIWD
ncbi:DinB family protein [Neobacillus drentensis]|uniref:DinB family protein n=1 Tax=Neobacillus drentensis TaxID=220684 RepID=UPI002FFEE383